VSVSKRNVHDYNRTTLLFTLSRNILCTANSAQACRVTE